LNKASSRLCVRIGRKTPAAVWSESIPDVETASMLTDNLGSIKYRRCNRCPIVLGSMFDERIYIRWDNRASLCHPEKYMFRVLRCQIKPIRVIKCSTVNTNNICEAFKGQKQFCTAVVAEMYVNRFSATFRGVDVVFRSSFDDRKIPRVKYRFDQIGAACCTLAELAVAYSYSAWLSSNFIP